MADADPGFIFSGCRMDELLISDIETDVADILFCSSEENKIARFELRNFYLSKAAIQNLLPGVSLEIDADFSVEHLHKS